MEVRGLTLKQGQVSHKQSMLMKTSLVISGDKSKLHTSEARMYMLRDR